MKLLAGRFCFPQQIVPTVGRVALLKAPFENRVRIGRGAGFSQRRLIVRPREDDRLGSSRF